MADEEALHRCVTKFMIDTCRYSTSEYATDVRLFHFLPLVIDSQLRDDAELFISGSSAEICIKPMLSCIGDIDVMIAPNEIIAIPHGRMPPSALPSHYQRDITVLFEIIDSHQPGFVFLRPSYVLRKTNNGRYLTEKIEIGNNVAVLFPRCCSEKYFDASEKVENEEDEEALLRTLRLFLMHNYIENHFQRNLIQEIQNMSLVQSLMTPECCLHGPALNAMVSRNIFELYKPTHSKLLLLNIDSVPCIRCLVWPPEANNWPTRNRDHGWPDQMTINVIVSSGCDLVGAVHPSCRQDEWMSKYQWRLSFSRAEVILLNSWTPIQQIVYHMLRFVLKRELLTEDPNLPKLCNYHIKTLTLCECEQKPQSWWSAESSLIKLCSSLLHKLSDWVSFKHCQQYFISNCNLLDHFVDDDDCLMICNNLTHLADESALLSWFIENYIRKCAHSCPPEVSILFEDNCSCSDKLERMIDAIVDSNLQSLPHELYTEHFKPEAAIMPIMAIVYIYRWDATKIPTLMKELQSFDPRLRDYFVALISLRVAYTISIHSLTEDLETLWTLFDPCNYSTTVHDMDTGGFEVGGILFIRKAIKLALLCSIDSNALEMLYNEMSKAYLHHSFTYGHESTYCVVHVLLAALYYKSGHYQAAIDHCKQVLNKTACEQYGLRCIGAEYLPPIDENVDTVTGLILFYQHIQQKALNHDVGLHYQQSCKPDFTTELLAYYLLSQCPNVANSKRNKLTEYQQHLLKSKRAFLCDVLLLKKMNLQLDEWFEIPAGNSGTDSANNASCSMDTSLLITTLELVALEKLIVYRQLMVRDLHSEQFPVLNEFEALYAYKCGLFEECLEMCRNHVNMLLPAGCSRNQLYMTAYPEFMSMFDGELVSLFGIMRLLHPTLFLFLVQFPEYESISVLTLSLYLMVQCQKKLRKESLHESLQLFRFVHDNVFRAENKEHSLDRLILKLTYSSVKLFIDDTT